MDMIVSLSCRTQMFLLTVVWKCMACTKPLRWILCQTTLQGPLGLEDPVRHKTLMKQLSSSRLKLHSKQILLTQEN